MMTDKQKELIQRSIDYGKEFVKSRQNVEQRVVASIDTLWASYAEKIIDLTFSMCGSDPKLISYSNNRKLNDEVDKILDDFEEELLFLLEEACCESYPEDKDDIFIYIATLGVNKGIHELIREYLGRWKSEMEMWSAIGRFKGWSVQQTVIEACNFKSLPTKNGWFKEAVAEGGFDASIIKNKGVSYGVGQYISSHSSIVRIMKGTIEFAWNWEYGNLAKNNGMEYFYQARGSDYHCPTCDSYVGLHPISDLEKIPEEVHVNCKCIRFYLTAELAELLDISDFNL